MKGAAETSTTRVKFKNPPINELVIGLYHVPVVELKAQHIGLYWGRISGHFPKCEQQAPIDPTALENVQGELFPLPRFWFYSESNSTLLQLQRNAFIYNWRRGASNIYPSYENVQAEFWSEFNEYQKFLQDTLMTKVDVIRSCELTYVNLIPLNKYWSKPSELGALLPPFAGFQTVETDERGLLGFNSTVVFGLGENLQLDLSVKTGQKTQTNENLAILEIKAHGAPEGLSIESAKLWYDAAHDAIYELFMAVSDKEAQQTLWEPLS